MSDDQLSVPEGERSLPSPRRPRRRRALVLGACALAAALVSAGVVVTRSSDDSNLDVDTERGGSPAAAFATAFGSEGGPAPGLTLQQAASGAVPAEGVYVVAVLSSDIGFEGEPSGGARQAVVDAVGPLGLPPEAVVAERLPYQTVVKVDVPLDRLAADGFQIREAVDDAVGGDAESIGLQFYVKDCARALAPLRQEAFTQIQNQARQWGTTTELRPGRIIAVSESAGSSADGLFFAGSFGSSGEGCQAVENPFVPDIPVVGLEAPREVELSLGLSVTFALDDASAGTGLTAVGSATSTVDADEAYILAISGGNFEEESDPETLSANDRTELTRRLVAAEVPPDQIDIRSGTSALGSVMVQVEVGVDSLAERGEEIEEIIEDVLGSVDTSGVWFSHSACGEVVSRARAEAVAAARDQAAAMASTTGVTLGPLQRATESSSLGPGVDPCDDDSVAAVLADDYGTAALDSYDSKPELRVTVAAALTFGVNG